MMSVPGRGDILFHKGNIPHVDSKGCVLLGENFGILAGVTAVLASGLAFTEFMDRLKGQDQAKLVILEV